MIATNKILKQRNVIPSLKNGVANYDTNAEKSEVFANHFESCIITEDDSDLYKLNSEKTLNNTNNDHNTSITPISLKEIQLTISKLASKKSLGHNLITNKYLKKLTSKALSFLALLYNSVMRMTTFSPTWKHAIIVPILVS